MTRSHQPSAALFLIIITTSLFLSCGKEITEDSGDGPLIITISDKTFVPDTITMAPGETLIFYNQDSIEHWILSASGEGLFDNTSLFDSNIIPQGEIASVTVPEDTPVGTTIYFYDDILKDLMFTGTGLILVE